MSEEDIEIAQDPVMFALLGRRKMRGYQIAVLRAISTAVLQRAGGSFVIMFPRQSGKNELQAQLEAYLLYILQNKGGEMVKISPTWRPQAVNAMQRLERVLEYNWATRTRWWKKEGYILGIGDARIQFFSGAPEANIVGATAANLLEVDEAQDISIAKFDKDIAPMAASTNATRVFWGTAWTSQTLLARELRANGASMFTLTAGDVAREVPAYGAFVDEQVARLGRSHPMVRTQYFSEEIDGQTGMFTPDRVARMRSGVGGGDNTAVKTAVREPRRFAMLLDVAGEDETTQEISGASAGGGETARRDATALTIVEVDLSSQRDPLLHAPTFWAVERHLWVGVRHTQIYGEIRALAGLWRARWLVVDATGVGAGLASFLAQALPGRVIPFVFSATSKSKLGWDFLEVVDSGRWREMDFEGGGGSATDAPEKQAALQALFFQQLAYCQSHVLPGPGRMMRWGVPDGARDPASGAFLHDDLIISAALCTQLSGRDWSSGAGGAPCIVRARDPLDDMRGF